MPDCIRQTGPKTPWAHIVICKGDGGIERGYLMRPTAWDKDGIAWANRALKRFSFSKQRKPLQIWLIGPHLIRLIGSSQVRVEQLPLIGRKQEPPFSPHQLSQPGVSVPNIMMQRRHRPLRPDKNARINQTHKAGQEGKPIKEVRRYFVIS